jgi:hypothetical protein
VEDLRLAMAGETVPKRLEAKRFYDGVWLARSLKTSECGLHEGGFQVVQVDEDVVLVRAASWLPFSRINSFHSISSRRFHGVSATSIAALCPGGPYRARIPSPTMMLSLNTAVDSSP